MSGLNMDVRALQDFAGRVEYLEKRVSELQRSVAKSEYATFQVSMREPYYNGDVATVISTEAAQRFFKADLIATEKQLRDVRAKVVKICKIMGK